MATSTNPTNAVCLTPQTTSFEQYMRDCKTPDDRARANNFLTNSLNKYKDIFSTLSAEYDNLRIIAVGLNDNSQSTTDLDSQIANLQGIKDKLTKQIATYNSQSGAADRMFLEDIYNGTPQKKNAPTLQDFALLLFWFGWLLMSIILVSVKVMSPDGGWKAGLFVLVILMLVTLCMFAIITYAA